MITLQKNRRCGDTGAPSPFSYPVFKYSMSLNFLSTKPQIVKLEVLSDCQETEEAVTLTERQSFPTIYQYTIAAKIITDRFFGGSV